MLIENGVMDALEYALLHDFTCYTVSVSTYAAGAACNLVGRNDGGGKVLGAAAVHAVLPLQSSVPIVALYSCSAFLMLLRFLICRPRQWSQRLRI